MSRTASHRPNKNNTSRYVCILFVLFQLFICHPASLFAQNVSFAPAPAGKSAYPDGPYRTLTGAPPRVAVNYAPAGSISVNEDSLYNTYTPEQLVENILITGCLSASNVTFTGAFPASTPLQRQLGYFNKGTSSFPLEEGLILSSGFVSEAMGPNTSTQTGAFIGGVGDPDLTVISGFETHDAAILEFDFIPSGNTLEFQYVFASEEYPEWCCTVFNDVFGFFLSGPGINGPYASGATNIALLPGTSTPVAINNIHPDVAQNAMGVPCAAQNPAYYIDNPPNSLTTQFDGQTVTLTATYDVVPCQTYHIRLSVADVSDFAYSSAVFLKAKSFTTEPVTFQNQNITFGPGDYDNIFEGCNPNHFIVTRNDPDTSINLLVQLQLTGTAVNGADILTSDNHPFPTEVTIPRGEFVKVIDYYAVADNIPDNAETFIVSNSTSCPCNPNPILVSKTLHIFEPLLISVITQDARCDDPNTGSLVINVSNGSGAYTYSMDGVTWGTTNTFSGLSPGTYTAFARDFGSCHAPVQSTVVIGQEIPVVANAGPDAAICAGSSTQLNGSGGILYSWSPPTGLSATNIPNPVAAPAITTTYSLTVTTAQGTCPTSDQVTVTVNPNPVAAIIPINPAICEGSGLTLQGSGGGTYFWSPGNEVTPSISVSPVSTTSYTLVVTLPTGCKDTAMTLVTVNPLPVAFDVTGGGMTCFGTGVPVGLSGSETDVTYQLHLNGNPAGAPVPGTGSPITFGLQANPGTYTVKGQKTATGCTSMMPGSATVFYDTIPPVIVCPPDLVVVADKTTCVAIITTTDPEASDNCSVTSVTWQMTGATTGQSPGTGINYPGTLQLNPGTTIISFTVTDGSGNTAICQYNILVLAPITANDDFVSTPEDTPLTIDILANDFDCTNHIDSSLVTIIAAPVHGTLDDNGSGIFSYTPALNFNGADSFTYTACNTDDQCDTAVVNIDVLPVNDPPQVNNESITLCGNSQAAGNILANDADTVENTQLSVTLPLLVPPSNGTITMDTAGNFLYIPAAGYFGNDIVVAQVCDSGNPLPAECRNDTLFITVLPAPWAAAGPDTSGCGVSPIMLDRSVAGSYTHLKWGTTGDGTFDNDTLLHPTYTPGLNDPENGEVKLYLSATGSELCGTVIDTLVLWLSLPPQAYAGTDVTSCGSMPVIMEDATAADYDSLWWSHSGAGTLQDASTLHPVYTPAAGEHGNILLTLHTGGSPPCEGATDEKIITILEPPVVSCGPDAGICESSQFPVQAASADHYISLLWSTTGTGSFNDPATLKPVYTPGKEDALAGSVLLILTAIPADGCPPASDTLKLTVNASPVVNAGPDLFLELNTSGTIHSSVSGGSGAFAYSWHPAELLNDPTVADPVTVSLNINVTFTLNVLDLVTGCTGKDSMKAVMTGTTLVPFAVDDFDSTSMNVPVTIPHLVNDFNPFQEPFSFRIIDEPRHGSGQPFNDSLINYTPYPGFQGNDSLTYEIYYSEGHPQTDTAVVHIHVGAPIPLHIFNTISPNGDGVNDEWIIRGIEEFPDNEVTVFNRWGDVIRTWTRYDNVTNVWDGSNKNNRSVPDGTYFYVIKAGAAGNFSGWIFVRANTD